MAERAISVRLDAEAQRALGFLVRDGISQSAAIRSALIAASRTVRYERMAEDAKRLGSDPHDRAVVAEIREFMDDLAPPW